MRDYDKVRGCPVRITGDNEPFRGPLADSRRDCCTYEYDAWKRDGWWTLCPAHVEATAAFRGAWPDIKVALQGPRDVFDAALAAIGVSDFEELKADADLPARFLKAWLLS